MQVENFYVLVGMINPKLDCEFAEDVNVHMPACAVGFDVVGITTGKILYRHEAISDGHTVFARKGFKKLKTS